MGIDTTVLLDLAAGWWYKDDVSVGAVIAKGICQGATGKLSRGDQRRGAHLDSGASGSGTRGSLSALLPNRGHGGGYGT